ncbi:MAG TPA: hypothetical protein VG406_23685 [Isosphaeraceae bacterium]|jgi:hypothetical protein|nr:hypothetical protein [Isosphaeraceae bacterium]
MLPIVGFFTDFAKDAGNDLWHQGTAPTPPPTLYLGLSTGDPLRSGAPAELDPAPAPGYARVAAGAASWSTSGGALVTNAAAITFPGNTAGAPWPTAYSLLAADAPTGGNVLWAARLTPDPSGLGQSCAPGKAIAFAPGAIAIQA